MDAIMMRIRTMDVAANRSKEEKGFHEEEVGRVEGYL